MDQTSNENFEAMARCLSIAAGDESLKDKVLAKIKDKIIQRHLSDWFYEESEDICNKLMEKIKHRA